MMYAKLYSNVKLKDGAIFFFFFKEKNIWDKNNLKI